MAKDSKNISSGLNLFFWGYNFLFVAVSNSPLVSGLRPGCSPPGQTQSEQKLPPGPQWAPPTGKPADSERVSAYHEKVVLASLPRAVKSESHAFLNTFHDCTNRVD